MQTSGLFKTHSVTIKGKLNKPIKLIPFGDIHRESSLHCGTKWKEFLDYAKAQKNAIFLGMGDYADGCSTSERQILNMGGLHETTKETMKDVYKGVTKTLANELSFMRGKCIGMLGGNHYYDFEDGSTTDHMLAGYLGAPYLGVCSFIRLSIDTGQHTKALDIFAHHGKGGAATPGGDFNTIEKMTMAADADIYLMGHTHKRGTLPSSPRLTLSGTGKRLQVVQREPWLGRTGSFLKAYESGKVSYNVDAGRAGCSLGWIEFDISVKRRGTTPRIYEFSIRGTA